MSYAPAQPEGTRWVDLLQAVRASLWLQLWTIFVLACVVWEPFRLGFYLDDWWIIADVPFTPFSPALFRFYYDVDPSRPGMLPIHYLLSSVLGHSPFVWQCAVVLLNVVLVVFLARTVQLAGNVLHSASNRMAVAASLCWMLLPWNAAYTFWPALMAQNALLIGFCYLLVRWMEAEAGTGWALAAPVLYFVVCIGYEMFYFQFLPLIAIAILLWATGRISRGEALKGATGLVAAQLLAALWYWASKPTTGFQRPIATSWWRILQTNLLTLVPAMMRSLREVFGYFAAAVVALLLVLAVAGFRALIFRRAGIIASTFALPVIALAAGLLSIVTFSLGQRQVSGVGVDSRYLALFNFWLLLGSAALGAAMLPLVDKWSRRLCLAICAVIGVSLGIGHVLRAGDWSRSWNLQRQILAAAPVYWIERTEPEALIVFVGHFDVNGVPLFSSKRDLNHAMPVTYGPRMARRYLVYNHWAGVLHWDGSGLAYSYTGPVDKASTVYVWKQDGNTFFKAPGELTVKENLTVE